MPNQLPLEQPIGQQPLPPVDPMMQNVGYIPPQRYEMDPAMSKHLDASEMLIRLKNTLMGLEYNEEQDEWLRVTIKGYDNSGNEVEVDADPLLPERTIRSLIGSLEIYLSPNTFLSQLKDEDKNDIMYGCQYLSLILYLLQNYQKSHLLLV